MKFSSLTAPFLSVALSLGVASAQQGYPQQQQQGYPQQQQQGYPQQQQPGYPQQGGYDRDHDRGGWDAPPDEFRNDIQRQGFRDGIQGARQDFEARRQVNPTYRPEYRHPPVPRPARTDYRTSFLRGYQTAMHHMMERHDHDHDRDGDRPNGYQPR